MEIPKRYNNGKVLVPYTANNSKPFRFPARAAMRIRDRAI